MGAIASPQLRISPMATLQSLWQGEMPEFASADELQTLANGLVMDLWNRLAKHQDSRAPFRLVREAVQVTRASLLALATMRAQELAGFVDGLFGDAQEMELPEKAHHAVTRLDELHGMLEASTLMLADETKPADQRALTQFARNAQEMTRIAEDLINKTIQSCKRARAGHLEAMSTEPTIRRSAESPAVEPPFIESLLS